MRETDREFYRRILERMSREVDAAFMGGQTRGPGHVYEHDPRQQGKTSAMARDIVNAIRNREQVLVIAHDPLAAVHLCHCMATLGFEVNIPAMLKALGWDTQHATEYRYRD